MKAYVRPFVSALIIAAITLPSIAAEPNRPRDRRSEPPSFSKIVKRLVVAVLDEITIPKPDPKP